MTIIGTPHERQPVARDLALQTRAGLLEQPALHTPLEADNSPVRIAVTDRDSAQQLEHLTMLLRGKGATIELVNAENLDEIGAWIQDGKINGVILTSWEEQHRQIAEMLDQVLVQNATTRPVPLLAYGESMVAPLDGINNSYQTTFSRGRVVNFAGGSHLRRWTRVASVRVMPDCLPNLILPPDYSNDVITATSIHDGVTITEGFEVMKGDALHVGVRFDLVELHKWGVAEPPPRGPQAAAAALRILDGFVETVRDHAQH